MGKVETFWKVHYFLSNSSFLDIGSTFSNIVCNLKIYLFYSFCFKLLTKFRFFFFKHFLLKNCKKKNHYQTIIFVQFLCFDIILNTMNFKYQMIKFGVSIFLLLYNFYILKKSIFKIIMMNSFHLSNMQDIYPKISFATNPI